MRNSEREFNWESGLPLLSSKRRTTKIELAVLERVQIRWRTCNKLGGELHYGQGTRLRRFLSSLAAVTITVVTPTRPCRNSIPFRFRPS